MYFFFSSRRRHTRYIGDWSSDVCSSDLMVPFGFSQGADAVHEIESAFEIGKQKSLLDVMAVDYFPIGKLRRQLLQRLAFEGRHAAPAGHAMLIGKIAHPRSTHNFIVPHFDRIRL